MKKTTLIIITAFALLILLGVIFTTKNDRRNVYNQITGGVKHVDNGVAQDGVYTLKSFNDGDINTNEVTLALEGSNMGVKFCNNAGGEYSVQENIIQATLVQTEMACTSPVGIMEMESTFMAALHEGIYFEAKGDSLIFSSQDGNNVFVFERGIPEPTFDGNVDSNISIETEISLSEELAL